MRTERISDIILKSIRAHGVRWKSDDCEQTRSCAAEIAVEVIIKRSFFLLRLRRYCSQTCGNITMQRDKNREREREESVQWHCFRVHVICYIIIMFILYYNIFFGFSIMIEPSREHTDSRGCGGSGGEW